MNDYLARAVDENGQFHITAAVTTGLTEEARRRHDTWPVATAALGRTLTAGLLLSANLKGNDTLTLRITGDGPLGSILVTANAQGEVRGYLQEPHVDLPYGPEGKLPVGPAVGKGFLHVTKDLGLKEPFTGSVELVSGEIGEDVAQYLLTSEQTPSAVSLGVLVGPEAKALAAGGLLLQLFPGANTEHLSHLERSLLEMPPISSLIHAGLTPEEIMQRAVGGLPIRNLDKNPICFRCSCSREKVSGILASLGREDIDKLLQEQELVEVHCHFCGEKYIFPAADLSEII